MIEVHDTDDSRLASNPAEHGIRGVRKLARAVAVVIVAGAFFSWRALAPIHAVGDASECERAYATATTPTDSLSVDLMSYPDPMRRGVSQRCGWRSAAPMQLMQR